MSSGYVTHTLSWDFVLGLGIDVDAERLLHIPGGQFYVGCIVYQGNGAQGMQTGEKVGPDFNGYLFHIGEVGTDPSGLIGFAQFGYSDSPSNTANWYAGGGLTALGLVPGRPGDTTGVGFAWSKLNSGADAGLIFAPNVPYSYTSTSLRASELMLQAYYQMNLIPSYVALQAAYTAIPTPGYRPGIPWANIFTLRMVLVL